MAMILGMALGLLLSGLVGYALGMVPNRDRWLDKQNVQDAMYLVFSGVFMGFILSVIIPQIVESSLQGMVPFGIGFLVMGLLNRKIIRHDVCCHHGQETRDFGLISLGAMAICSTNDGIFLGLVNPEPLSSVYMSMLLHKLTISFMVARIIHACALHIKGKISLGAIYLIISPVTFLWVSFTHFQGSDWLRPLLGISGGVLAYVAIAGTIPRVKQFAKVRPASLIWLVVPLLISLYLGWMHFEAHAFTGHVH